MRMSQTQTIGYRVRRGGQGARVQSGRRSTPRVGRGGRGARVRRT